MISASVQASAYRIFFKMYFVCVRMGGRTLALGGGRGGRRGGGQEKMSVGVCRDTHSEVRGQLLGVCSPFSCRFQALDDTAFPC